MALAYSVVRQGVEDLDRWVECDVTFDSSYPTGGEAVSLASLGLKYVKRVSRVSTVYPDGNTSAQTFEGKEVQPILTDPTAPLLKLWVNGSEAANASDQSAVVKRLRFIGS